LGFRLGILSSYWEELEMKAAFDGIFAWNCDYEGYGGRIAGANKLKS
jgi:hypothetical protein